MFQKKQSKLKEFAAFAGGGAAAGAIAANVVGRIGLAAMGGAIGIGSTPVVIAGTVVGLAAYGVKKALDK